MAGGDAATAAAEARGASRDAADDGRAGGGGPERMAGKGRVSEEAGAGDGAGDRAHEARPAVGRVEDLGVLRQVTGAEAGRAGPDRCDMAGASGLQGVRDVARLLGGDR